MISSWYLQSFLLQIKFALKASPPMPTSIEGKFELWPRGLAV